MFGHLYFPLSGHPYSLVFGHPYSSGFGHLVLILQYLDILIPHNLNILVAKYLDIFIPQYLDILIPQVCESSFFPSLWAPLFLSLWEFQAFGNSLFALFVGTCIPWNLTIFEFPSNWEFLDIWASLFPVFWACYSWVFGHPYFSESGHPHSSRWGKNIQSLICSHHWDYSNNFSRVFPQITTLVVFPWFWTLFPTLEQVCAPSLWHCHRDNQNLVGIVAERTRINVLIF